MVGEDDPCPNADFTEGWRSIFLQQVQSNSKVKRSAGSKKSAPIVKPSTCNLIDPTFHGTSVVVAGDSTNLDEFGEHTSEFSETGIDDNEPDVSEPSVTSTFVTEADARFSFFLALQNDLCSSRTFKDLIKLASKALIPMPFFASLCTKNCFFM